MFINVTSRRSEYDEPAQGAQPARLADCFFFFFLKDILPYINYTCLRSSQKYTKRGRAYYNTRRMYEGSTECAAVLYIYTLI